MQNADIARVLSETADALELAGGNPYKVRAYRQAAQIIDTLPEPVSALSARNELTEVPGVGERIAGHIRQLLDEGDFDEHRAAVANLPPGVLEMLSVEGVGPKTVALAWKRLGVCDIDGLEAACRDGRLEALPRMGPSRVSSILKAIGRHRGRVGRAPLHRACGWAEELLVRLRAIEGVICAEAAGSLRRRRETIGDIDLLVCAKSEAPIQAFVRFPEVASVIGKGSTKASVRLKCGMPADLRLVPPESFGAALHYFTGSKAHNIELRTRAQRLGLKVNEYGVFDESGARVGGATEEEVFRLVGLPYIPPELREGAGEIEAAAKGELPRLVTEEEVIGDLHVHTRASTDARSAISEVVEHALACGRSYLAITEHSRSRPLGMDAEKLNAQREEIARINAAGAPVRLLAGIEVDILPDGSLDLPPKVLAGLDWVVASIHVRLNDPPERITERLVRAIRTGVVDVIGHPTGRQIGRRDAYAFDFDAVLEEARDFGVALEVNAQPERLDLDDKRSRAAKAKGVKLVISSDAHAADQLANLRYGIWTARRGWLEATDVLNTMPCESLLAWKRSRMRAARSLEPR